MVAVVEAQVRGSQRRRKGTRCVTGAWQCGHQLDDGGSLGSGWFLWRFLAVGGRGALHDGCHPTRSGWLDPTEARVEVGFDRWCFSQGLYLTIITPDITPYAGATIQEAGSSAQPVLVGPALRGGRGRGRHCTRVAGLANWRRPAELPLQDCRQ